MVSADAPVVWLEATSYSGVRELGFCAAKDLQETRQLAPSLVQAWEVWWRQQRHSRVVDLTATLAWEDLCFVLA